MRRENNSSPSFNSSYHVEAQTISLPSSCQSAFAPLLEDYEMSTSAATKSTVKNSLKLLKMPGWEYHGVQWSWWNPNLLPDRKVSNRARPYWSRWTPLRSEKPRKWNHHRRFAQRWRYCPPAIPEHLPGSRLHLLDMRLKHADRLDFEVKITSINKTPLSICQIAEFCLSLRHRTQRERLVDYRILGLSVAFCVLFFDSKNRSSIWFLFAHFCLCIHF